jgi:hypothetical protein
MIGWIAGLLLARHPALTLAHARRLAWIVAVLGALFIAAAGIGIWLTLHDRAVIERHETKRQLNDATAALEGEHRANEGAAMRDQARADAHQQTEDELEKIHAEDPDAAAAPASRGTRAVARRLPTRDGQ